MRFDRPASGDNPSSVTAFAPSPVAAASEDLGAARLFEAYGDRIYRYCLARLRSREEAEDAVQNTFLRVYQALRKGQVPRWEEAWLYKIAHNVCLSRSAATRRRAGVELTRDLGEIEYALPAREHRGDELFGLADALAELPANLRTAILLREWQGLSYVEIAGAMGTTVSAVETLIVRARKRLAATLDRSRSVVGLPAGLVGRLQAALLGSGPAKLLVGGALVIAAGGAGVGTAIVESPGRAPAPDAPTLARTLQAQPIVSIPSATVPATIPARPDKSSRAFARSTGAAPVVRDRPATPSPAGPTAAPTADPTPAPAAASTPAPAGDPSASPAPTPVALPTVPDATDSLPSLPPPPSVPTLTTQEVATASTSTDLLPPVAVPSLPVVQSPLG